MRLTVQRRPDLKFLWPNTARFCGVQTAQAESLIYGVVKTAILLGHRAIAFYDCRIGTQVTGHKTNNPLMSGGDRFYNTVLQNLEKGSKRHQRQLLQPRAPSDQGMLRRATRIDGADLSGLPALCLRMRR